MGPAAEVSLLAALGTCPRRASCSGHQAGTGECVPSFCLLPAGVGEVG